jgi:NADPH:quinone reductase-like Zn-dependent oxidoreductase
MQADHLDHCGSLDGLVLRDSPTPVAARHEVVVRVRARSVNFRDLLIVRQRYLVPERAGIVPLSDGAGEVVVVGEDVTRFVVGDRVSATYVNEVFAWDPL